MNDIASTLEGSDRNNLAALLRTALSLADKLGLSEVAIHIDIALIALTGHGIEPPSSM